MRKINRLGGLALIVARGQSRTFSDSLPEAKQTSATTDYYLALAAMKNGTATPDDFRTLAVMVNVCRILTRSGYGLEHAELVRPAFDALHRIQQRRIHKGVFGSDGDGLAALRAIGELIEEQGRVATVAEIAAAHDEMHDILAKGKLYAPDNCNT